MNLSKEFVYLSDSNYNSGYFIEFGIKPYHKCELLDVNILFDNIKVNINGISLYANRKRFLTHQEYRMYKLTKIFEKMINGKINSEYFILPKETEIYLKRMCSEYENKEYYKLYHIDSINKKIYKAIIPVDIIGKFIEIYNENRDEYIENYIQKSKTTNIYERVNMINEQGIQLIKELYI